MSPAAAVRSSSPVTPPCSPRLSATCISAAPIHPNAPKKSKSATLIKVSQLGCLAAPLSRPKLLIVFDRRLLFFKLHKCS